MHGNDNKIDWSRPETCTLAKLSNWTARREHFKRTASDGELYIPAHLLNAFTDHIKDAPVWALRVPCKLVMFERLAWLFDGKDPQKEQQFIQMIKEEYSYEN